MAEKKIVRRGAGPFAISGNDLREGHVVWLAGDRSWTRRFEDAAILQTEAEAADAMTEATSDRRELAIVEVHLVDVVPSGRMLPVTYRERVRAFGPTTAFGRHLPAEVQP